MQKALLNKYNIEISVEEYNKNIQRLTNQIWKLIPMKEHEENWQRQLNGVIIEIVGLNEFNLSQSFIQLLSKLEGLSILSDLTFENFRRTVFECIGLLQEGKIYEE